MRHDFIDRYSRLSSPIHGIPTSIKLIAAVVLIVAVVWARVPLSWFHLATAIVLIGIAALSRIPPMFLVRRLILLEPFVLGVALLTLLQPNGTTVFLSVVVKSTLCLFTIVLLSNTTPFSTILALLKRVGTPAVFVSVLALLFRYLFVLIDEAERMQRARRCRTVDRHRLNRWKLLGTVIGQLFVRSTDRAERIYAAMCARGWK